MSCHLVQAVTRCEQLDGTLRELIGEVELR